MIGIYQFINKVNGKQYIGQSINVKKRIKEHFYKSYLESGQDYNSPLHCAIRKYGEENFEIILLKECSYEELDYWEKYYIKLYNTITPNGYNIDSGGQKSKIEPVYCKECGKVISKDSTLQLCWDCYNLYRASHIPTKENLQQILLKNNGNFTQVGKIFNVTDNAVRKWCIKYGLSTHSSDYKINKLKKPYATPVNQIDMKTGEIINTFESANAAARALGKTKGNHITEVCKGSINSAYGYKWEYATLV